MRILFLLTAIVWSASGSWAANEAAAPALVFEKTPATTKMLLNCERYTLDKIAADPAEAALFESLNKKKAELTEKETTHQALITQNLSTEEQADLDKIVADFQASVEKNAASADTFAQKCEKLARDTGKAFDKKWATKHASPSVTEKATPPKPASRMDSAGREKVLASLRKTLVMIDDVMANKLTSEEEKVKLLQRKQVIEQQIEKWESQS